MFNKRATLREKHSGNNYKADNYTSFMYNFYVQVLYVKLIN